MTDLILLYVNPKMVGLLALLVVVSGATFWSTRSYFEAHPSIQTAHAASIELYASTTAVE